MSDLLPSPTADTSAQRLSGVLQRSRARLERNARLSQGLELAVWANGNDELTYSRQGHHTLSVYLAGGEGSQLKGDPAARGGAWRHCVFPAEHETGWLVREPVQFLHLYVSDLAWADRVVRLLDAEPRTHTLTPAIYAEDAGFAHWACRVSQFDWNNANDLLTGDTLSQQVLDRLVLQSASVRERQALLRPLGGLSAVARRHVLEYIDAHLAESGVLTLSRLGQVAHLSEFHFARMFRQSMGCTPHDWIALRRLARVRELLGHPHGVSALEVVAAECGYSSASHLARCFRAEMGVTPTQYARARRNT